MNEQILVALTLASALLGCESRPSAAAAERLARPEERARGAAPEVRWFGALKTIVHEGRTEAAVRLSDVLPGPHAWGLGALEGLRGEVTVLDDVVWLARPGADGTAKTTRGDLARTDADLGAALFVVANVEAWEQVVVARDVPFGELDAFLAAELSARGLALDTPVPLRIDGPVAKLAWHVIDGSRLDGPPDHESHARSAIRGAVELADVRLVGFFSSAHQGVFTHAGARSHFHALLADGPSSGHVDGMVLKPGARLLIGR